MIVIVCFLKNGNKKNVKEFYCRLHSHKVVFANTAPMLFGGIIAVMYNYISNMNRDDIVIDVVAINKLADKKKQQLQ